MEGTIVFSQPYLHPRIPTPQIISPPRNSAKPFSLTSSWSSQESIPEEAKKHIEIRVCTERSCRKRGSFDTLQVLSGIAPPNVAVNSSGCLGRCGTGPNGVVLPQPVFFNHCGAPYKAASLLLSTLKLSGDYEDQEHGGDQLIKNCLEAFALRKREEDESSNDQNLGIKLPIIGLYQYNGLAIDLNAFGGLHVTYKARSAVSLTMGEFPKALEDAKAALALAPKYSEAYICLSDALMAMDQIEGAEESYSISLELNPSLRRSKSFKAQVAKLQEKLAIKNIG